MITAEPLLRSDPASAVWVLSFHSGVNPLRVCLSLVPSTEPVWSGRETLQTGGLGRAWLWETFRSRRVKSRGPHSQPELRVLPQPEMRHWVPAGAQVVGREMVDTRALMTAGEESLISMMSLSRVQLLKRGWRMTLAELMNCSLPSTTSMLCSPSLTWMRLWEGKHEKVFSPRPQFPPRSRAPAHDGGVGSTGVTPRTVLLQR